MVGRLLSSTEAFDRDDAVVFDDRRSCLVTAAADGAFAFEEFLLHRVRVDSEPIRPANLKQAGMLPGTAIVR